jgi:hypothetical protein
VCQRLQRGLHNRDALFFGVDLINLRLAECNVPLKSEKPFQRRAVINVEFKPQGFGINLVNLRVAECNVPLKREKPLQRRAVIDIKFKHRGFGIYQINLRFA